MELRTWLGVGCLCLGLTLAGVADGQAGAAPHELVLIEPLPEGAAARIAGQTADLQWTLARVAGPLASIARVQAVARERGARAVAWILADAEGFHLRLFDPRRRRLLERRFAFGARGDALARSAALEALALSVRSSLRALAADEEVGEVTAEEAGTGMGVSAGGAPGTGGRVGAEGESKSGGGEEPRGQAARAAGEEEAEAEQEREEEAAPEEEEGGAEQRETGETGEGEENEATAGAGEQAVALALAAGWDAALDGQSPYGQQGPFARIGVAVAGFEFAAQLQTALAGNIEREGVEVALTRQLALASIGADLYRSPAQRVALGVLGGVAFFDRDTNAVPEGLRALPERNPPAAAFGIELRGAWRLVGGRTASLELELAAGALLIPAAPVLRYEGIPGPRDHALWVLEPYLHLGPRLQLAL